MWTFKELKELLLLICISQIPFCPNVESEATTDSTSSWQWQYNLCQPRPIFQIGENDISLPSASCLEVGWAIYLCIQKACYLWWLTIPKLLFNISCLDANMVTNDSINTCLSLRFTEMFNIWKMTGQCPFSTSYHQCDCYHSHCHPWWSSSANNSFSENIDREKRYSEWHSELLIWDWIRYCHFSWVSM